MDYRRVIPRDLFNEAKLLKSLGKLYIEAERHPFIKIEHDGRPFKIMQNSSDGSIYVENVRISTNTPVHCYTTLNARGDWPLYAEQSFGDETVSVFDDDGNRYDMRGSGGGSPRYVPKFRDCL